MLSAQINELVTLAKKGDADAFGELYELYYKEMYCYACCVTGSESLAQDAVSDAVLSAFSQIKSLKNSKAFKGWLFRILCAACKRYYTENEKKKSLVYLDDENGGRDEPADFGGIELSFELKKALETLSVDEREIVLLKVLGGYKSHEIADILDCPSSTVRSKYKRSLDKLRNALDGEI
ncbi:MAG: sigma-70 family RNA polymerase sigma factor [Ruminococcaceae bacterium]|nr:sigma-70 family RNA polymerase sigma factor [Oscillospiraceae bacterium]